MEQNFRVNRATLYCTDNKGEEFRIYFPIIDDANIVYNDDEVQLQCTFSYEADDNEEV